MAGYESVFSTRISFDRVNKPQPAESQPTQPVQAPVESPPEPAPAQAPVEKVETSETAPDTGSDTGPDLSEAGQQVSEAKPELEPESEFGQVPASEEPEIGQELELPASTTGMSDAPAGVSPAVPSDAPSAFSGRMPEPVSLNNPPSPAAKGLADSVRAKDADKTSYCRVPVNIMNMIRQRIPASNRNDALTAYLYVTLNREPVVGEEIKTLAASYTGDSEVANLKSQVDALSKSLDSMTRMFKSMDTTMSQMMTMLVWLVGERMDASIDLAQPVASMDFLFQEHEFIRRQAASQTAEYSAYLAELAARARYKAAAAVRDSRRRG